MGTDFRKEIGTTIDQRRDEYTKISDAIWGFAEPRFQEYESTKLQQEFLKARGFSVKADLAGEETAFIAEWGSGKPILAFLGEFDALSSLQHSFAVRRVCPPMDGVTAIRTSACGFPSRPIGRRRVLRSPGRACPRWSMPALISTHRSLLRMLRVGV